MAKGGDSAYETGETDAAARAAQRETNGPRWIPLSFEVARAMGVLSRGKYRDGVNPCVLVEPAPQSQKSG